MVAKTVITQAGIAAVIAAGSGGPAIKVAKVRFGSTLIDPLASMTDVDSFVYESTGAAIRYSIRDENSVNYRIILDETIGDFTIGNYALVLEDGTIFSITSLNSTLTKTATVGMVLGNRRIFNLPLVLSGLASISNFTLILADELSIPEVATQAVLPGAGAAPFNLYLVRQHTLFANRATLAAAVAGSWRYFPEDLGAGAAAETNGITIASAFDVGVSSGNAVWFNTATDKFELSNVSTHPPRGIRGQGDTFHSAGSIYTHGSAIYTAGSVYYAQADGTVSTVVTDYEVGFAVSTTKLFVTAGLVQGHPWGGGGGGYTPSGRVKTMFLTGPAWWGRQQSNMSPTQQFTVPTDEAIASAYYYVFPKTTKKYLETMIPVIKSLNRAVACSLLVWWARPTVAGGNNVKWGVKNIRFAEGVSLTNPASGVTSIVDSAPSGLTVYLTGGISLDLSGYGSADEISQLMLTRLIDDGADTLQADAYVLAVALKYTEATDTDA